MAKTPSEFLRETADEICGFEMILLTAYAMTAFIIKMKEPEGNCYPNGVYDETKSSPFNATLHLFSFYLLLFGFWYILKHIKTDDDTEYQKIRMAGAAFVHTTQFFIFIAFAEMAQQGLIVCSNGSYMFLSLGLLLNYMFSILLFWVTGSKMVHMFIQNAQERDTKNIQEAKIDEKTVTNNN